MSTKETPQLKQGDLVRISPTRFARITRIMFHKLEVREHVYAKIYRQFEIARNKISLIDPNVCENCGKTFHPDDMDIFYGPKTMFVCCDCYTDVKSDAEQEANDCPTCGGSGGGPEHWRCTSCRGTGMIKRDKSADDYYEDYDEDYGDYDDPAMDYINP